MTQDAGMDVSPSWQELHDEVERLQPLVDLYAASLKKAEAERDALAEQLAEERRGDADIRGILDRVKRERDALAAHVSAVPDGVWEALQRLIENAQTLGEASQEDALLVARHRDRHRFMGNETSTARLKAEWQAEEFERFADKWPWERKPDHKDLRTYARALRRQAEGGDS